MRNNDSLYFDIWRKKDFIALLKVYTQTAHLYKTKDEMRLGFADMLDEYVEGGRQKYRGTSKQWSSAYTLGRELGIFRSKIGEGYELSKLAQDFLESKVLGREYLLNYLLNLNQLIDEEVVHPLFEVLTVLQENGGFVSKREVTNIEKFKLQNKSQANQRQLINVFFHRMEKAGIVEETAERNVYKITTKYSLEDLLINCNISTKTPEEFELMTHEKYVDMLSTPSPLIPVYKGENK